VRRSRERGTDQPPPPRHARGRRARAGIVAVLAALAVAGGVARASSPPPAFSSAVDGSVKPAANAPGLASVVGSDGSHVDFRDDRLVLGTDDPAALEKVLARWQGKVLDRLDPGDLSKFGMPTEYVIRIDPSLADPGELPAT
jgi:hypothetical protein